MLDVERLDLSIGQRHGLRPGANEAGHTGNVANNMPALIRHHHLHEHIARENLCFYFFFDALFVDRVGNFHRNLDIEDQVTEPAVLHDTLDTALNLVFVTGIGVCNIPSGTEIHLIDITHVFAPSLYKRANRSDRVRKTNVKQGDNSADDDGTYDDKDCVLPNVLPRHPYDLLAFAGTVAEESCDSAEHTHKNVRLLVLLSILCHMQPHNLLFFRGRLLRFLVQGVFAAETAILVKLKSVGVVSLVLFSIVVSLLAFGAGESHFDSVFLFSHLFGTS